LVPNVLVGGALGLIFSIAIGLFSGRH